MLAPCWAARRLRTRNSEGPQALDIYGARTVSGKPLAWCLKRCWRHAWHCRYVALSSDALFRFRLTLLIRNLSRLRRIIPYSRLSLHVPPKPFFLVRPRVDFYD